MDSYTQKQIAKLKAGSEYGKQQNKKTRLKDNITYYNMRAMEAYERGDYAMAADYAELMRRNLERLESM